MEVKKMPYSRKPWRIIVDGYEFSWGFNGVSFPVSFSRKSEAIKAKNELEKIREWKICCTPTQTELELASNIIFEAIGGEVKNVFEAYKKIMNR